MGLCGPPWDTSLGFSPRSLRSLGEARREVARSLTRLKTLTRCRVTSKGNSGTTSIVTLLVRSTISIAILTPGITACLTIAISKRASEARRFLRRPGHLGRGGEWNFRLGRLGRTGRSKIVSP